ncbi:hypothetical protein D9M70_485820 [compost metagenome]
MWHAAAARLLVIGEGEAQRPAQVHLGELWRDGEGGGQETLHVGGAPPIESARLLTQTKGVARPAAFGRRNDVHVTRKKIARHLFRTDCGEQVRPIALRARKQGDGDAVALQIVADPGNDVSIGGTDDGGEADELFKDIHCLHSCPHSIPVRWGRRRRS